MHQAKTHLSKLVEKGLQGEDIVIGKAGVPLVKLVVIKPEKKKRTPGAMKGKIWMAPDFDECDAEIEKLFYGEDDEDTP